MDAQSPPFRPRRRSRRGFTLVELLVAVSLATVLMALAAPSFRELTARMRVEGVAHNLATDLQLARTEAVQRRAAVNLVTAADGASYSLTTGGNTIKSVPLGGGATLTASITISFEALRGLANAAVLDTSVSGTSAQLRVSSDVMGRVQMCSPSGVLKGYATC
ncbi:MAG: GspH/FimT family pseudopilin [Rubrivivax sp.]